MTQSMPITRAHRAYKAPHSPFYPTSPVTKAKLSSHSPSLPGQMHVHPRATSPPCHNQWTVQKIEVLLGNKDYRIFISLLSH